MTTPFTAYLYTCHRLPAEIISHCVWPYFCFFLSYRDVDELMAERRVTLTYEAVRFWCRTFGQPYANQLRRRRPRPGDTWHLDEVFLTVHGERHYRWRAVDQDATILDILVQRRRDKTTAKRFCRKLLKSLTYVPQVIITDQLKSYGDGKHELLPGVEDHQHRYLNNPGGKLPSAHPPARAAHARVQVGRASPVVPRGRWSHCPTLPTSASPSTFPRLPPRAEATIRSLSGDHQRDNGRVRGK